MFLKKTSQSLCLFNNFFLSFTLLHETILCRSGCSSSYVQLKNCLAASHRSKHRPRATHGAAHNSPDYSGANHQRLSQNVVLIMYNNVVTCCPQSRPAVTTSTAVLPTVVAPISATRTQSPVISPTVTHSPEVAHG